MIAYHDTDSNSSSVVATYRLTCDRDVESASDAARAICDMVVRGAPLIGATAAYGVALAVRADPSDASLDGVGDGAWTYPAFTDG